MATDGDGAGVALAATPDTAADLRRGVILALLATMLWSCTSIFLDAIITGYGMTPLAVSCWRALLVAVALGIVLATRYPAGFYLSRRETAYYFVYGAVGIGLFNVVWSTSVQVNRAAVATALFFSAPAFVAIGERLIFKTPLLLVHCAAIAVTLAGCGLVAGLSSPAAVLHNPAGLLLGLASGGAFSLYTLLGRGVARRGRRSLLTVLFYTFGFAALSLLPIGLASAGPAFLAPPLDSYGWVLLLALTFGPTLGGYACYNASLRYLSATRVSLLTTLEPPITAVLALLFLGRSLNAPQWLGAAFIMAGVLFIQRPSSWRWFSRRPAPSP